jgi:hypothetical protein
MEMRSGASGVGGERVVMAARYVRGVMIVGVRDGRIAWGRLYLEEAGAGGGGMRIEPVD